MRSNGVDEAGKLFIGGLSWDTTQETLLQYFSRYGEVVDCVVMKNQQTGKSRGFGFVTYKDANCVHLVLSKGPHQLDGRTIDPKACNPRSMNKPNKNAENKGKKIFIGGLPPTVNETDLKNYFSSQGNVQEVVIMYDQEKKRSRGFGFLSFDSEDAVDRVCQIHFFEINGKQIEVKKAEPRDTNRPPEGVAGPKSPGEAYHSLTGAGALRAPPPGSMVFPPGGYPPPPVASPGYQPAGMPQWGQGLPGVYGGPPAPQGIPVPGGYGAWPPPPPPAGTPQPHRPGYPASWSQPRAPPTPLQSPYPTPPAGYSAPTMPKTAGSVPSLPPSYSAPQPVHSPGSEVFIMASQAQPHTTSTTPQPVYSSQPSIMTIAAPVPPGGIDTAAALVKQEPVQYSAYQGQYGAMGSYAQESSSYGPSRGYTAEGVTVAPMTYAVPAAYGVATPGQPSLQAGSCVSGDANSGLRAVTAQPPSYRAQGDALLSPSQLVPQGTSLSRGSTANHTSVAQGYHPYRRS